MLFATEDEQVRNIEPTHPYRTLSFTCVLVQDAHNWVMAFYRATGQAHKPTPPVTTGKNSAITNAQGADADKARKHGMEEFIAADPITFDHHKLFSNLQASALDWRLKDPFASLGKILHECTTRYG